jgi:translation initiation factor 2 subunit 1
VKIKRITNYGAVAELTEFPGKEGFIHISQVSSSWVKNIRSVISEGQMRVAKIRGVDLEKKTIDLSLRDVSAQMEKRKNEDYKREKKADKLFERISEELKEPFKESYKVIAIPLEQEFGDLFSAFENSSIYGEEAIKEIDIPEKWKKAIVKHAQHSISSQKVQVEGALSLVSYDPDGVEKIKKALERVVEEDVSVEYISAPKYKLKVKAIDYETAEKKMKKVADSVLADAKKFGEGSFERKKA